jgi:hypothetical protein
MAKVKRKTIASVRKTSGTHPKAALITWIVVGALVLGLVGGYFFAKIKYGYYNYLISVMYSQRDSELNQMKSRLSHMNGVFRVGGKMMIMKEGAVSLMTDEMTLSDGTKVMPNGKYQKPGADTMMLQNGQAMDMNGNIIATDDENRVEF